MSMKTTLGLATLAVIALLVAGIAYWALRENPQLVAPSGSAGAPPVAPQPTAPPAPPASQSASTAPPSQATGAGLALRPAAPSSPAVIAQSNHPAASPARIASHTLNLTGKRSARAATSAVPSNTCCPDDNAAC